MEFCLVVGVGVRLSLSGILLPLDADLLTHRAGFSDFGGLWCLVIYLINFVTGSFIVISVDFFGVEFKLYRSLRTRAVVTTVKNVVLGDSVLLEFRLKSKRFRIGAHRNFTLNVGLIETCINWQGQAAGSQGHSVIPDLLDGVEVGVVKDVV